MNDSGKATIYYDGACRLCNTATRFVLKHDAKQQFDFVSLRPDAGKTALSSESLPDSVILKLKGRLYFQSDAVLKIFYLLGGFWRLLYVIKFIPRFLRNPVYRFIARNRYKWFGQEETCMLHYRND